MKVILAADVKANADGERVGKCRSLESSIKAAESIPDGYTTKLMQEYAKKYQMVIVAPLYEEALPGCITTRPR